MSRQWPLGSIVLMNDRTSQDPDLVPKLCDVIRNLGARGWAPGTGGTFSVVESDRPMRMLITASGVDKQAIAPEQILRLDSEAQVISGDGKPSAETLIHLAIVRETGAGCVLHTHSIWNTILSVRSHFSLADPGSDGVVDLLEITGFEMLKGLAGVTSHEHRETVPIIANSQEMGPLSRQIGPMIWNYPDVHGFLLRGHGLYTWGADLAEAKRHVEVLEFLFEVIGRQG